MRKSSMLMAAAAVAVAGMTFVPASSVFGEDAPSRQTTPGHTGQSTDRSSTGLTGQTPERSSTLSRSGSHATADAAIDQKGVQECLAKIVEDATTPGKISDLMNQISTGNSAGSAQGHGAAGTSSSASGRTTPGSIGSDRSGADSSRAGASDSANRPGSTGATGDSSASSRSPAGTSGTAASGQQGSAELDMKIAQLQKDWKAKYNQDFKLSENKATVFNESFARIQSGDMGDTARTAGERQSPSGADTSSPRTGLSGTGSSTSGTSATSGQGSNTSGISSSTTGNGTGASSTAGPQTNGQATPSAGTAANGTGTASSGSKSTAGGTGYTGLSTGAASGSGSTGTATANTGASSDAAGTASHRTDRGDASRSDATSKDNTAMVTIPASHDAPALNLRFSSEGGTWKLETPKHVDQQQLQANIAKHLDMVDQMKDKWPADVNDAYRAVSHHVLMAVNETASMDHSTK
jgi:hypothetical protein